MARNPTASRSKSLGVTQLTKTPSRGGERAQLTLRIDFGAHGALGPGKIKLLEQIDRHGSISAAGRSMDMSYRRAWLLVEGINDMFDEPAVSTQHGGPHGGGAALTKFGQSLIEHYRDMEREAEAAVSHRLRVFQRALADVPPARPDSG